MTIRNLLPRDREVFLAMCRDFYHSPAVLHPAPDATFARTFAACLDQNPLVRGLLLEEEGAPVGYAILAFTYSAEVGGTVVLLDELYLVPEARGRGWGSQFFAWLFDQYPQAARFRLEVTAQNPGALALYRRLGFAPLDYCQMILDKGMPQP